MKKMMDDRLGPTAQGGGSVDTVKETRVPEDVLGGLPGALALRIEDWAVRLHGSAGIKAIAMLECTSRGNRGHFRRTPLPATAATAAHPPPPPRRTEYERALGNEAAAAKAQAAAERTGRRRHQRLVYKQRRVAAATLLLKHRGEKNVGLRKVARRFAVPQAAVKRLYDTTIEEEQEDGWPDGWEQRMMGYASSEYSSGDPGDL